MSYNPQKEAVVIAEPFGAVGIPIDARNFFLDEINLIRRPFASINEAIEHFDTEFKRTGKFIVYINSTGVLNPDGSFTGGKDEAYEWRGGVEDEDLVPVLEKGDKGDKGNKGWTKNEIYEEYIDLEGGKHLLKKFVGYINGEGDSPVDTNIGKYVKADLTYTDDKELAADFKGDFIMALYLEVDDDMNLIAHIPDNYEGIDFELDDTGHLIIEQTV